MTPFTPYISRQMPGWLASLLGLLIPVWFWIAKAHDWPFWPAGLLLLPLAWRGAGSLRLPRWILLLAACLGLATVLTRNELPVLFYPVLVNAAFFSVFAISLRSEQTVIERLARLREPNLPPAAIAYTRKVTVAWCLFFVINGGIALWTTQQDRMIWTVYNGAISYLLTGLMFASEWLLRQRMRKKMHE